MDEGAHPRTFLFTDIEGSTSLWERRASHMSRALARHDELVRNAIEQREGRVFKTVGDAFYAVFDRPAAAIDAAIAVQRSITEERWGDTPIVVRCAIHTGTAEERGGDYFGPTLNRVARLLAAAHGGQSLVSAATAALTEATGASWTLADLGTHRLRDLEREERIFQVRAPGLPTDFPPIRTLRARHDNIPPERTTFVGREAERQELREMLLRDESRVLTLVGPGGCGKTRLAIRVAADCIESFADGACFVPLAELTDPSLVASAIAQALSLREGGERPINEVLREYLQTKSLLLVLDNFEQVIAAAGEVATLAGDGIKIVVTSRTPLRIYGEVEYPVPTLETPAQPTIGELMESAASRLFIERAGMADARFAVSEDNAASIAEICRRLEGLPLAIELAAARVRLLAPPAMLARLDNRLSILTGGARDLPARQQTMRAAIDWSHALLDERERALFRRLSVFAGSFVLDAAERIGAVDPDNDVLSDLESLLEKSLVGKRESTSGEPRFYMLETIREYALEQLEASGETATMRERHAAWMLDFAEMAHQEVHGPKQLEFLAKCEEEHDNARAALAWHAEGRPGEALRLSVALAPFWRLHGHLAEGRWWLSHALALAGGSVEPRLTAEALLWSGLLATHAGVHDDARRRTEECIAMTSADSDADLQGRALCSLGWTFLAAGDVGEGLRHFERAVSVLRSTDDAWGLADALHFLGHAKADSIGLESSRPAWDESLRIFRMLGDGWSQALPLKDLGLIAARTGDLDAARPLYEASLSLLREIGDKWHVSDTLMRLGELDLFSGQPDVAIDRFREALVIARDLDNKAVTVEALMRYAEAEETQGDYVHARLLLDEALTIASAISHDRLVAAALHNLAHVALHEDDVDEAERMFSECASIHARLERELEVALTLAGLAVIAHRRGNPIRGARLLGASDALRGDLDFALRRSDRLEFVVGYDAMVASVRGAAGDDVFEREYEAGRTLDLRGALTLAGVAPEPAHRDP